MTYTIKTADNSTRTITDTETSLKAALRTARQRQADSVGGNGSCDVFRDGIKIRAWREGVKRWYPVTFEQERPWE